MIAINTDGDRIFNTENQVIGKLKRKGGVAACMAVKIYAVYPNASITEDALKLNEYPLSLPRRIKAELLSIPSDIVNLG